MVWWEWILFIVNTINSCIIGNILGELTIRWWYKKRKNKE